MSEQSHQKKVKIKHLKILQQLLKCEKNLGNAVQHCQREYGRPGALSISCYHKLLLLGYIDIIFINSNQQDVLFPFLCFNVPQIAEKFRNNCEKSENCLDISFIKRDPKIICSAIETFLTNSQYHELSDVHKKMFFFSTIPNFFGYFLNEDFINLYLLVLTELKNNDIIHDQFYLMISHLFLLPDFLQFMRTVMKSNDNDELSITKKFFLRRIDHLFEDEVSIEEFRSSFISTWARYAHLIPRIIKDAICCYEDIQQQKELFYILFTETVMKRPELFFFNLYCLNLDLSHLSNVFSKDFCGRLWDLILLEESLKNTIFFKDSIMPIFTRFDHNMAHEIKELSHFAFESIKAKKFKHEFNSKTFASYEINFSNSNSETEPNDPMPSISDILVKMRPIQLPDEYECDPWEILEQYCSYLEPVEYQLKVLQSNKTTLDKLLSDAREKFESRSSKRLKQIQEINQIFELHENLKKYFTDFRERYDIPDAWFLKDHFALVFRYCLIQLNIQGPIQDSINGCIDSLTKEPQVKGIISEYLKQLIDGNIKAFSSIQVDINQQTAKNQLTEFFQSNSPNTAIQECIGQLKNDLQSKIAQSENDLQSKIAQLKKELNARFDSFDTYLLHNFILQNIPKQKYLEKNPNIQSLSRLFFFMVESNKEFIMDNLFPEKPKYTDLIKDCKQLFNPFINEVRKISELDTTPQVFCHLIQNEVTAVFAKFEEMISKVLGAPERAPLRLFILANSNIPELLSLYQYLYYFMDGNNNDSFLSVMCASLAILCEDDK